MLLVFTKAPIKKKNLQTRCWLVTAVAQFTAKTANSENGLTGGVGSGGGGGWKVSFSQVQRFEVFLDAKNLKVVFPVTEFYNSPVVTF